MHPLPTTPTPLRLPNDSARQTATDRLARLRQPRQLSMGEPMDFSFDLS